MSSRSRRSGRYDAPRTSTGGTALARILVVDDDRVIQQLVEVNLELEGYEVVKAGDGEEALTAIESFNPDLIVLDVMMPRMDGREVCRRIKGNPETQHIPVIFLSARAQDMDVQSGLELGASAYLTKPFDPVDLIETVERVLAGEQVTPPN